MNFLLRHYPKTSFSVCLGGGVGGAECPLNFEGYAWEVDIFVFLFFILPLIPQFVHKWIVKKQFWAIRCYCIFHCATDYEVREQVIVQTDNFFKFHEIFQGQR